jgi:hypothetical protein
MRSTFLGHVTKYNIRSLLDSAEISAVIDSNTASHRRFDVSFKSLLRDARIAVRKSVVDSHADKADAAERSSFRETLTHLAERDVDISGALDDSLKSCLRDLLRNIRSAFAEEQLRDSSFREIIDDTWEVPEDTIILYEAGKLTALMATEGMLRSRFGEAFLTETVEKLEGAVDRALREAGAALGSQLDIVERLSSFVQDHTENWTKSAALDFYVDTVTNEWTTERRLQRKNKYIPLFDKTKEEIEEEISRFFKELEESEERRKPKDTVGSGDTPGQGPGPGGPGSGYGFLINGCLGAVFPAEACLEFKERIRELEDSYRVLWWLLAAAILLLLAALAVLLHYRYRIRKLEQAS